MPSSASDDELPNMIHCCLNQSRLCCETLPQADATAAESKNCSQKSFTSCFISTLFSESGLMSFSLRSEVTHCGVCQGKVGISISLLKTSSEATFPKPSEKDHKVDTLLKNPAPFTFKLSACVIIDTGIGSFQIDISSISPTNISASVNKCLSEVVDGLQSASETCPPSANKSGINLSMI